MDSTDSVTAQNRIESNRTGSSAVRVTTVVLPSCRPLRPLVRCLLYVLVVLYLLSVSSLRSFLFFPFVVRCSLPKPKQNNTSVPLSSHTFGRPALSHPCPVPTLTRQAFSLSDRLGEVGRTNEQIASGSFVPPFIAFGASATGPALSRLPGGFLPLCTVNL